MSKDGSTPQLEIDLMFWQYAQGVKDTVTQISATNQEHQVKLINQFIYEKLVHIRGMHRKNPSWNLRAEVVMGIVDIKKYPL